MVSLLLLILSLHSAEAGFTPLFNGTDLHGWKGDTMGYRAHEGELIVTPLGTSSQGPGHLYTTDTFNDFELRFEFKLTPGANNGLAIRAPGTGDPAYSGMEIQILDNMHPKFATLKPWQYHGSIYGIAPARRGFLRPPGQWNDETVICDGHQVTVVLNGHVIVHVDLQDVAKAGCIDGNAHQGMLRPGGHIGFCGHGSEVAFRDIRIRLLEPSTVTVPQDKDAEATS